MDEHASPHPERSSRAQAVRSCGLPLLSAPHLALAELRFKDRRADMVMI